MGIRIQCLCIDTNDPAKTASLAESISPWTGNSKEQMKFAQDKVKAVAASGQLGIFANGYWGHPAMHLSPDVNLLAFSHYLQALDYRTGPLLALEHGTRWRSKRY